MIPRGGPSKKVRQTVDLVVIFAMRKGQNLPLEFRQPWFFLRQKHAPCLDER
jgi:hypothetical protein